MHVNENASLGATVPSLMIFCYRLYHISAKSRVLQVVITQRFRAHKKAQIKIHFWMQGLNYDSLVKISKRNQIE